MKLKFVRKGPYPGRFSFENKKYFPGDIIDLPKRYASFPWFEPVDKIVVVKEEVKVEVTKVDAVSDVEKGATIKLMTEEEIMSVPKELGLFDVGSNKEKDDED